MSAPRSLLRLATPLMVGRGISAVVTFSIPIVLARALEPAAYGTYKQFFLLAATVYLIGQVGLTASLYYFIPRNPPAERGRYFIQALAGLFLVGAAAAAIVMGGTGIVAAHWKNPALAALAPALALYIWAFLGAAPFEIGLTAINRTTWSGASYVISDILRTAAMVIPIKLGLGVTGLAWAVTGFAVLRLVAAWALALSGAVGRAAMPTRATLRKQLGYSLPFAGAVLLATAQMQLPQMVVASLTDTATYAIYAVGVLQIPLTDMLYTPIAEVMMVRLASAPPAAIPAIFREAVSKLVLFFLPLTAFAMAAAPELIPTLYTTRYLASVPIFMLALIELPLSALPVDGLLRSLDATGTLLRFGFVRLITAMVLVPALFLLLGLPGAMLGYIATQWGVKAGLLTLAARRLGVPTRSLIPWPDVTRWTARAAATFAAVSALRLMGPFHGVRFIVAGALLSLVIWLASLRLTGRRPGAAVSLGEAHG